MTNKHHPQERGLQGFSLDGRGGGTVGHKKHSSSSASDKMLEFHGFLLGKDQKTFLELQKQKVSCSWDAGTNILVKRFEKKRSL